jgi:hypothetical protein
MILWKLKIRYRLNKSLPLNSIQTCPCFAMVKEKSEKRMVFGKVCSGLLQPRNAQKKVREKITF